MLYPLTKNQMKKIKVLIDSDEMYPVYSIYKEDNSGWGGLVEIDQKLFDQYEKVMVDFKAMQKTLKQIYNSQP